MIFKMSLRRFKIKIDPRTTFTVNEDQIFKKRWVEYFGSIEQVEEFIKNYE
jgi:hypothetical protein